MEFNPRAFPRVGETRFFERIHRELCGKTGLECAMTDGMVVQARRKAPGAGKALGRQAVARPRGGLTTRVPMFTDTRRRLADFRPLPGQAHGLTGTRSPLKGTPSAR